MMMALSNLPQLEWLKRLTAALKRLLEPLEPLCGKRWEVGTTRSWCAHADLRCKLLPFPDQLPFVVVAVWHLRLSVRQSPVDCRMLIWQHLAS
jgi:hypothetical protein